MNKNVNCPYCGLLQLKVNSNCAKCNGELRK